MAMEREYFIVPRSSVRRKHRLSHEQLVEEVGKVPGVSVSQMMVRHTGRGEQGKEPLRKPYVRVSSETGYDPTIVIGEITRAGYAIQ